MAKYDYYAAKKPSILGQWINSKLYEKILAYLNKNQIELGRSQFKVLELGPGRGQLAQEIKKAEIKYMAIEGNAQMAKNLTSMGLEVYTGYLPPLPENLPDFNQLIMVHFLEHLPDLQKVQELIGTLHQALPAKGKGLVLCPDILDLGPWFYECDYTHQFPTSANRLIHLFQDHGFKVESHRAIYGGLFGIGGAFGNFLAKSIASLVGLLSIVSPKFISLQLKIRMLFAKAIWIELEKND